MSGQRWGVGVGVGVGGGGVAGKQKSGGFVALFMHIHLSWTGHLTLASLSTKGIIIYHQSGFPGGLESRGVHLQCGRPGFNP